jgi:ribosomal protein S18 acetylase RimI-like enzyme
MRVAEAIAVRPYEPGDAAFIARLAKQAFDEYTPDAVSHTLDMAQRFTTLVALQRPRSPLASKAEVALAPSSLRRVGFVSIGGDDALVAQLHAIAVSDRERGRGIGRRLMAAFERVARARGARRLELCTADCNLAALDLFYRCGFRLWRRRQRFYARGQDACVLIKDLELR